MAKTKSLILLRHAAAATDDGGPDRDRRLSEAGARGCELLAAYLGAQASRPGLVLCSPAARTREAFKRVANDLGWNPQDENPKVRFVEALYFATAVDLLTHIQIADDGINTLLVVGHNPEIEDLVGVLA